MPIIYRFDQMASIMKLFVSTRNQTTQNSLIISSHKEIPWIIFIDHFYHTRPFPYSGWSQIQNSTKLNQYFRLEFIGFSLNTVTVQVLIYCLIKTCITVKWVLHTCTSKLERIKSTAHNTYYIYIYTCYVLTCTSTATAMHIQGSNKVLQKCYQMFIV